jgi:signal transduction histidine kinase
MSQRAPLPETGQKSLRRVILVLLGLAFLALMLAAAAAAWLQVRNQEYSERVNLSLEAQARIGDLATLNERVETARRGYLVSGDPTFRRVFEENAALLPESVERVTRLTAEQPEQRPRLQRLIDISRQQRAYQQRTIDLVEAGRFTEARGAFDTDPGVRLTRQARALIQEIRDAENRILTERTARQENILFLFYLVLGGAGLLLVVVAAMTILAIYRYTRDLSASRDQLRLLNEELESKVVERTAELHRSNAEIQRFAYIVSHDLRSPLVNVMGFTSELDAARRPIEELLDKAEAKEPALVSADVRAAVREDLPEAIAFIRTSTQKMDRLINAILHLSRQGRRTLAPEPLHMGTIVQAIVDTLHRRAADAGAEIAIEGSLPDIVSDRLAIEQIFSNLIENAVKYAKPGRPGRVTVRGSPAGGRMIYEIEDNGRGIDPRDHERIFELFRRSGTQDQPGEGIGLAHVRALLHRLGGVIEVRSELDRGSTFRLSLPPNLNKELRGD